MNRIKLAKELIKLAKELTATKMPIKWHKENLNNRMAYNQRERKRLEEGLAKIQEDEDSARLYAEQIAEAERRGLTEFDRDRLSVKKP